MAHETKMPACTAFWSLQLKLASVRDEIKLASFQAEDIEASFEGCSRDADGDTAWIVVRKLREAIAPLLAEADAIVLRAYGIAETYSALANAFECCKDVKQLLPFPKVTVCIRDELDEEERA